MLSRITNLLSNGGSSGVFRSTLRFIVKKTQTSVARMQTISESERRTKVVYGKDKKLYGNRTQMKKKMNRSTDVSWNPVCALLDNQRVTVNRMLADIITCQSILLLTSLSAILFQNISDNRQLQCVSAERNFSDRCR